MSRRIVITSGKGGVGKTTIVSSLGWVLASKGYRVLLVDMDFGLNNLDVVMGVENKIVYDIIDVIEGKCDAKQALIQDFFESNLYILPTTHGYCKVKFGATELSEIILQVENLFDFVLIDCPAGIDGGFRRAVASAGEYVIVTTPHLSAVRDAGKTLLNLKNISGLAPYLIINRARGDLILGGEMLTTNAIVDFLDCSLIGVVPEDDEIARQNYFGGVLNKRSQAMQSIDMIADNMIMGSNKIFDCTKKYKGVIGRIRSVLRRKV